MDIDCQVAGNYTCAAANDYGSDQRQFTLTIIGKSVSKQFNIGLLVETKWFGYCLGFQYCCETNTYDTEFQG